MAEATLTRGIGYWVQGPSFYNTADNDDWSWYVGQWNQSYGAVNGHGAGCVEFTVPEIIDARTDRTVSIQYKFIGNTGACKANAVLSTTKPSDASWLYGPTSGIISDEVTFTALGHYTASLVFTVADGVDISGKAIYLYLYNPNSGDGSSIVTNGNDNEAMIEYTEAGLVYIGGEAFMTYIGNGTSWDMYIPHIGNGSNWEFCS